MRNKNKEEFMTRINLHYEEGRLNQEEKREN